MAMRSSCPSIATPIPCAWVPCYRTHSCQGDMSSTDPQGGGTTSERVQVMLRANFSRATRDQGGVEGVAVERATKSNSRLIARMMCWKWIERKRTAHNSKEAKERHSRNIVVREECRGPPELWPVTIRPESVRRGRKAKRCGRCTAYKESKPK